jgi:hypothetical protein
MEDVSENGASVTVEALRGEPGAMSALQGTLKDIYMEGSGNGHLSPEGLRWGT